jgi:hypothetical protein
VAGVLMANVRSAAATRATARIRIRRMGTPLVFVVMPEIKTVTVLVSLSEKK